MQIDDRAWAYDDLMNKREPQHRTIDQKLFAAIIAACKGTADHFTHLTTSWHIFSLVWWGEFPGTVLP